MDITRDRVLEKLHSVFPNNVLCKEDFSIKNVSAAYHHAVFKLAKENSLSSIQWLIQNGFHFVEKDMRPTATEINKDNAASLADSILRKYPLAGQHCLSLYEKTKLFAAADLAFQKICIQGVNLTLNDELILTLATIERLKEWAPDNSVDPDNAGGQTSDSGRGTFWSYFYQQYGLPDLDFGEGEKRQ